MSGDVGAGSETERGTWIWTITFVQHSFWLMSNSGSELSNKWVEIFLRTEHEWRLFF